MNIDAIIEAYRGAEGRWTRCDWDTEIGEEKFNLKGLSSVHANIMAEATSGAESEHWHSAAAWLRDVESNAQQAEIEARAAYELVVAGQIGLALSHAHHAVEIESRFHGCPIWSPLVESIETALEEVGSVIEGSRRSENERQQEVVFMPWTL